MLSLRGSRECVLCCGEACVCVCLVFFCGANPTEERELQMLHTGEPRVFCDTYIWFRIF